MEGFKDKEREKNVLEGVVEDEKHSGNSSRDTESTLDAEIKAGEWQRLGEFDVYNKRTRQGKIIAMIEALSNRIVQLEKLFYQLVSTQQQKAPKLLKELKRLRYLKEYLLQALIWEEQGEFDIHDVPLELEELI